MPKPRGVANPIYTKEFKDLAIHLYVSGPLTSLKNVADKLNTEYHLNPPLSSDSIGRWVEAKGEKMKRTTDLLWIKRREKYGKSGMKPAKVTALTNRMKHQWSDMAYKRDMILRMRKIKPETAIAVIEMHQKDRLSLYAIKRELQARGLQVLSRSTIYKILKNRPLSTIVDVPCFECLINQKVTPYHCNPIICENLNNWVLAQVKYSVCV